MVPLVISILERQTKAGSFPNKKHQKYKIFKHIREVSY